MTPRHVDSLNNNCLLILYTNIFQKFQPQNNLHINTNDCLALVLYNHGVRLVDWLVSVLVHCCSVLDRWDLR